MGQESKGKATSRGYYERTKGISKARALAWNRANPECRSQITRKHYRQPGIAEAKAVYQRQWRKANRDKTAAYSVLHNSARRGGIASIADPDTRDYVGILRHDKCSYCGCPAGEIDHIDSVLHAGANDWTNFTACCRSCNSSKRDHSLLRYLIRRGDSAE